MTSSQDSSVGSKLDWYSEGLGFKSCHLQLNFQLEKGCGSDSLQYTLKYGCVESNLIMKYKLAICLFKLYNMNYNVVEFCLLDFNQVITSHQMNFITIKNNRTKVGIKSLSNRLHSINNLIPLEWLNLSIGSFKINCKKNCCCNQKKIK